MVQSWPYSTGGLRGTPIRIAQSGTRLNEFVFLYVSFTMPRRAQIPTMPGMAPGLDDLRVLYDVHGSEIFRFCFRLIGERGQAEEATQETFLKAWRARDRWSGDLGSVRTWLFSIARNVSIDMLRARAVRPTLPGKSVHVDLTQDGTNRRDGSTDAYDYLLDSWTLEEGLRRLRDDQRYAIVETYVKGRSYAEVATELGVPDGTVRTRVFYGLKSLRVVLEEMGWNV
jgi:RNA polymerase sigma-70 factor, ECF subfamily